MKPMRSLLVVALCAAFLLPACGKLGIDRRDEHGMTALMYAARDGNRAEAERLIARGANVNAKVPTRDFRELIAFISWMQQLPKSDIGYTPLLYAAQGGHVEVAALLIGKGAKVNEADRFGTRALALAVFRSDVRFMTLLADAGATVDARDLASAVARSTPETVQFLLARGANPNAVLPLPVPNYKGPKPTLLILAVGRGDPAIVRLLIDAGADVRLRDENGWTALRWAKNGRSAAIAQLLEQAGLHDDGATDDALIAAARDKDPAGVTAALARQADPQTKDQRGVTPLVVAARNGDAASVDALLRAGADANVATPYEGTPLIAAAMHGHAGVIERLLTAGADPRHRDPIMRTALYTAASRRHEAAVRALLAGHADANDGSLAVAALRGDLAVVTLLLEHGADARQDGAHALSEAARGGKDDVVVLLLERGADPRGGNAEQGTPLHRAASNCGPPAISALIAHGADPNARDTNGSTPLVYAVAAGRLENVRALIAARADVNARGADGRTILQHAARHPEIEQELRRAGAR